MAKVIQTFDLCFFTWYGWRAMEHIFSRLRPRIGHVIDTGCNHPGWQQGCFITLLFEHPKSVSSASIGFKDNLDTTYASCIFVQHVCCFTHPLAQRIQSICSTFCIYGCWPVPITSTSYWTLVLASLSELELPGHSPSQDPSGAFSP